MPYHAYVYLWYVSIYALYFLHDYYVYIRMLLTMSFLWWISGIFLISLLHCADVQRLNHNVQYWRTRWVPVCFLHIYTHCTITCMRTAKVIPCMGIYLKTASSLSLQCYKMQIRALNLPAVVTTMSWLGAAQCYSYIKYKIRPRSTPLFIYMPLSLHI